MTQTSSCVFCDEIADHPRSVWNNLRGNLPANRTIHQSPLWLVMPPLGCFVPGGLLLLLRRHVRSCSEIDESEALELDSLMDQVARLGETLFGSPMIFFEHGPGCNGSKGACCVDHAHVNVFPANIDIWKHILHLENGVVITHARDIAAFRMGEYLWIRDGSGLGKAYAVEGVPSQYIRSLITKALGIPNRWHWRDYLGLSEIGETIDLYSANWS